MSDHKTVLNDHVQLDALLRDLRIVCSWEPGVIQQYDVRARLANDIRALKDQLRRHFATEESGSYLEEITSRKPDARKTLLELHSEHIPFLNLLTGVEKGCTEYDEKAGGEPDLQIKLRHVLDLLKLHEQRETALIREVFSI
jgi:hemerythrin HHE cation binding domain-containing protein